LCVVEVEGVRGIPTACTLKAGDGMVVKTRTAQVDQIRQMAMELMLASHPQDCLVCTQNLNCELQAVAQYMGIAKLHLRILPKDIPVDTSNPLFDHDLSKCILCGRCVRACYELRGVGVLSFVGRGRQTYIGTAFHRSLAEANCRFCGACVEVCPTGALRDKGGLLEVAKKREEVLVPCRHACPAEIDIPRYIHFITEERYSEAAAVIRERVPFPNVLGLVCNHPCETACRRSEVSEAVAIRALKRAAAERDTGSNRRNPRKAPSTGKKVAIVGSGPAGLTAAYYLSKAGHGVVVFEALPVLGGMLRVGIPEYRLPRRVLDAEIREIVRVGLDIRTNTRIESLDDLFMQGYHAVFLAIGAHQGNKIGVEGEDSSGVIDAVALLRTVSLGERVRLGDRVAVVGGGNVAIDAARTALRLGTKDVTILYRRTRAEMPASPEEVEGALEEGVRIAYLVAPNRIWNEDGAARLQCIRMELGEVDASGRRRPVPIKGSEFTTDYDNVVAAIGQMLSVPDTFKVAAGRGGGIRTWDNCTTSLQGVFAGGDAVTGPASVIEAIASGRRGAVTIDRYLGGTGVIDEELAPVVETKAWLGCGGNLAHERRPDTPCMPVEERLSGFDEIERGYDAESAHKEALRCLKCDLRLKISPPRLPPKRSSTKGS
jgi:NADPH-dependent glutamate synthase beta subunit-like oxidoreductase/NAD-dependent dihydropyrimidine dehydrogenase PreA subunit